MKMWCNFKKINLFWCNTIFWHICGILFRLSDMSILTTSQKEGRELEGKLCWCLLVLIIRSSNIGKPSICLPLIPLNYLFYMSMFDGRKVRSYAVQ